MKETNLELFNRHKADLIEYEEAVKKIEIKTADDMLLATGLKNKIQSTIKQLDGTKVLLKKPVIQLGKDIEKAYKEAIAPFKNIKLELGEKQIAYQEKLEKQKEQEAMAIRAELERKKALMKIEGADEDVNEVLEGKAEDKMAKLDNEAELARQKGIYKDYEVLEINFFTIDKKYLNIKPLEIKADLLKIKKDLKEGLDIIGVKANLVTKIK